ncbi:MAG: type III pantothenate kinase, partial [Lachnospiraceae bacterium]|nr:type III pantothenate kinase [Lachnospiraceae bacterium]
MLFVIDVGNTNITCGVYNADTLTCTFRIQSKTPRTSDEFGMTMCDLITRNGVEISDIDGVIIASVVPNIMHSLTASIVKYLGIKPLVVGPGIKTGINIDTPNPKEIGPDRIVDAVAAYEIYGGPILVLDFGTATTYDLVTEDGRFTVGITAPGVKISAEALWLGTAKLPEIEIEMPKSILANDTIWSMQAGLMYGQIGQTEYIINQVKKETGYEKLKVVATGGLGRLISNETGMIDEYNSDLTLEGLRLIYA